MSLQLCNELIMEISGQLGEIASRVSVHQGPSNLLRIVILRRHQDEKAQTITIDESYPQDWKNGIDAEGRKHPSSRDIESNLLMAIMKADSLSAEEEKTSWTIDELIEKIV